MAANSIIVNIKKLTALLEGLINVNVLLESIGHAANGSAL